MHLTLQTSLKNKEIHLLIDDDEFEYKESINIVLFKIHMLRRYRNTKDKTMFGS